MAAKEAPLKETVTVTLGVTDGIQEQLDGFEWDFQGYDLCTLTGDLKDIKLAVALLSAKIEPQLSPLETIRIARDLDEDSTFLVMVLKENFEHLQVQLKGLLDDGARYAYAMDTTTSRIVPVTELPEDGDLIVPVEAMSYLHEPLIFDRLIITTESGEEFFHSF